jgi:hypothetical protein
VSEQGQASKSGLEAFKGLIDYINDSFIRVYDITEVVPANFAYELAQSNELAEKEKAGILQSLGEIGIMVELIKTGYDNGLGRRFLEDSDNVKEFAAIMSDLLTLYRAFRNGEMIKGIELSLNVGDVVADLKSFFIRYMKSINVPEGW